MVSVLLHHTQPNSTVQLGKRYLAVDFLGNLG